MKDGVQFNVAEHLIRNRDLGRYHVVRNGSKNGLELYVLFLFFLSELVLWSFCKDFI